MITTPNPIRFYGSKDEWLINRTKYKGAILHPSFYTPTDRLPTFNLMLDYFSSTPVILLYKIDIRGRVLASEDISTTVWLTDFYADSASPLKTRLTNYSKNSLLSLETGWYYLDIAISTTHYISEPFYCCENATQGTKIEFFNSNDFVNPDVAYIAYQINFTQKFYLDGNFEFSGDVDSFSEEVKRFDNTSLKVYQRISPIYQIEFVANQDFLQFMNFMSLHDNVLINGYSATDITVQRNDIKNTVYSQVVLKFRSNDYVNGDNSTSRYTFVDGNALLNIDGTPLLNIDGTPLANLR